MGYWKDGSITNYTPDDDENTMWLEGDHSLDYIIEECRNKWGGDVDLSKIIIEGQKVHTRCIYYDLYDSGDYDNYLCITLRK